MSFVRPPLGAFFAPIFPLGGRPVAFTISIFHPLYLGCSILAAFPSSLDAIVVLSFAIYKHNFFPQRSCRFCFEISVFWRNFSLRFNVYTFEVQRCSDPSRNSPNFDRSLFVSYTFFIFIERLPYPNGPNPSASLLSNPVDD